MVVSVCESWREVQVWGALMEVQVQVWLNGALRHCWISNLAANLGSSVWPGALALAVWSGALKRALGLGEQRAYSTQALSSCAHRHCRSVLEAYRSAEASARLSAWQTHQLQQHHRTG